MKPVEYIDMTPTWAEILPTWKLIVRSVLDGTNTNPEETMENFWDQMAVMANAADKWNEVCKEHA